MFQFFHVSATVHNLHFYSAFPVLGNSHFRFHKRATSGADRNLVWMDSVSPVATAAELQVNNQISLRHNFTLTVYFVQPLFP